MPALTNVTRWYDNVAKMADDLLKGIGSDCGMGFLVCDNESDYSALATELDSRVSFPIIGATSPANPAFHRSVDVGASLTVLTGDRAKFGASLTAPLYGDSPDKAIETAYREAVSSLGVEPKLILATFPIIKDLAIDRYLPKLFELAGDTPVFGGMASDDYDQLNFAVIAGGAVHSDRASIVAIGGDISPVFATGCDITVLADYAPTVTEVDGNVVRMVDDMSFCGYMKKLGFNIEAPDFLSDWPLAVLVRMEDSEGDELSTIYDLMSIDLNDCSGRFSNKPPLGARLSPGTLRNENITASADSCMTELLDKIKKGEEDGHKYDIMACIPGVSRYYAVAGDQNKDLDIIEQRLPEHLALFGFYGFNEICPVTDKNGKQCNRDHRAAIVACAF